MLESLLKLFKGQRSEKIIWTADLEYWVTGHKFAGTLNPKYEGEKGRLELARDTGLMPYYWYEQFWLAEPVYDGINFSVEKKGTENISVWNTPVGELEERSVFAKESCSQAAVKHPVENKQDLETLLYILEHRQLKPANLDTYDQRRQLYAEYDGIPSIAMPRSPLSTLAVEWCGIEKLSYFIMDYPDLIQRILTLFKQQEKPIIEAVCETAPPLVHFADNVTSDFYTYFFDKYMADFYQKRLDILHSAGVSCAVHLDGTVRGMLPKLASFGFDAIKALTPVPGGYVPFEKMRELAGNDNVILWGAVPGTMFCEPYTWKDMEKHVEKVLSAWKRQRFVLGVADQVPANGDIEICRKISEMIKDIKL